MTSAQVTFKNPRRTALTAAKTINLYAPNSVFGDRFTQLDVALNKTLQHRAGAGCARVRRLQRAEFQFDSDGTYCLHRAECGPGNSVAAADRRSSIRVWRALTASIQF